VKAFDIFIESAFLQRRRYGLSKPFVNIIIRLHKHAAIKVEIGLDDSEFERFNGVQQGSCEGPVLFLFIMQAALETMKWPVPKPEFCIRENGVTMCKRTGRKRGTTKYKHSCSLLESGRHRPPLELLRNF
jgi:hypothetical protein